MLALARVTTRAYGSPFGLCAQSRYAVRLAHTPSCRLAIGCANTRAEFASRGARRWNKAYCAPHAADIGAPASVETCRDTPQSERSHTYHTIQNHTDHRFFLFSARFGDEYGQRSKCMVFDEFFTIDKQRMILIQKM